MRLIYETKNGKMYNDKAESFLQEYIDKGYRYSFSNDTGLMLEAPVGQTFSRVTLEKVEAKVATKVKIPIIGIGAGGNCDGQVLVIHDLLGITKDFNPRFLRRYLNLFDDIKGAVEQYVTDVKSQDFPNEKEQY